MALIKSESYHTANIWPLEGVSPSPIPLTLNFTEMSYLITYPSHVDKSPNAV